MLAMVDQYPERANPKYRTLLSAVGEPAKSQAERQEI
jgi:hypothetical protein